MKNKTALQILVFIEKTAKEIHVSMEIKKTERDIRRLLSIPSIKDKRAA